MPKVLAFDKDRRRAAVTNEHGSHATGITSGATLPNITRLYRNGDGNLSTVADITVSVVVPTKGRPQLLKRCLASLALQRFDAHRYEIIVVDDAPDNDTREVALDWSNHCAGSGPDILYIPSLGPHGPAAARNIGWQAARGEIIAFTDDDTIAGSAWLKNGVAAFNDDVHAVWGKIVMPLHGTPTDYQLDAKNLENAEFVTANCFCRKRVLEDIGGFDERFRFAWREDADLHFILIDYSAGIAHAPDAVVTHPIRPAHWGVSLSQLKKIQFDALLYKKHPALYRQKIRARPRWDFYLTVAALFACLGGAWADTPALTLPAALGWLFMTARFCAQRLKRTSKAPSHVAEMIVTSILIPPLAVFWRAVGAFKFRAALI